MRARAFVPMFLFAISLPALAGEEKKEDAIKVDLSYLEKNWGIKYKSYIAVATQNLVPKKADPRVGQRYTLVKIVMEFTKDVENLKELQKAINLTSSSLGFRCFDEDNVGVFESCIESIEGGVSGKKGDAIRVWILVEDTAFKKTRKIEARPKETEKDKGK